MPAVAATYRNVLGIDLETSVSMAKLTRGYAFAFQVLGYFTCQDPEHDYHNALVQYRLYLDEFVYNKLWFELSDKDRKILECMAKHSVEKVAEIKELCKMSSNDFSAYRQRLIRKGIVDGTRRGVLTFTLPLFEEYIRDQILFSE